MRINYLILVSSETPDHKVKNKRIKHTTGSVEVDVTLDQYDDDNFPLRKVIREEIQKQEPDFLALKGYCPSEPLPQKED